MMVTEAAPVETKSERRGTLSDPVVACLSLFLGICACLLVLILRSNQGHFSYTLDDPYIHLALAERLAAGHYGLNLRELTTPSSSILWPFMLVPGAGSRWHPYLPLVYNLLFGSLAACLMGTMARSWKWLDGGRFALVRCWTISALLVIGANLPGLTFTGMEHVLQVWTAVVCAHGVMRAYQGQRIPGWCVAVVLLAPSVRYESYVLCLALAVALYAQRRGWAAFLVLTVSLVPPLFFAWFLLRHGHPPLPNSVLVKGAAFATHNGVAANLLFTMKTNALAYVLSAKRWPFTLVLPLLLAALWKQRKNVVHRTVLAGVSAAVLLQMLAGAYGWFHRYEVFAKVLAVLVLFGVTSTYRRRGVAWVLAGLLALADVSYLAGTAKVPLAAQNIYQQQYQMHRLIARYGGNFAVNDLGWVSYQLDPSIYVLDLVGLASLETMKQVDKSPEWLDEVTHRHGCGLVMIYPQWFPALPKDWVPVARLTIGVPQITVNGEQVYFYETPFGTAAERGRLRADLQAFGHDLPPGVGFMMDPPPPPAGTGKMAIQ